MAGMAEAPPVRATTASTILEMTARNRRPDLPPLLPGEPAAAMSGFTIAGRLPPGIHLARLEAQLPDKSWRCLKSLSVAVEARPFAAAIEAPATDAPVRTREHVEGWALDPAQPLQALALRYGHQEIACLLGRPRSDLSAPYPESPHSVGAGFKSEVILSAGRGPLRLKARLADGTARIARTPLMIDVATDEHHDARLDFGAARLTLAAAPPVPAPSERRQAARPLNLLFILPGSFASNSALHVAALANELAGEGHVCVVAVAHDLSTLSHHLNPRFRGLLHGEAEAGVLQANGRGPDIIHAWTTRENVRVLSERLRLRHGAKVVVHLEDNEPVILAHSLGRPVAELERLSDAELDRLVPGDLSHPRRSREFLARADAVTVITDRLRELVPAGRPCHTVWPAADARYFFPRPLPVAFRRLLDRSPEETVLFYHGNTHAANAAEMGELCAAVLQLNRAGLPVTLIRTGLELAPLPGTLAQDVAPHLLNLGQILHHHHLPALMALADIFVQPGQAGAFNDYRFPSKLPEFFALGRPVVLPRTNLGSVVRHGVDAYVLERADAAGIAAAVTELRRDAGLRDRLSRGATDFAAEHFSWRRSAEALANFYASLPT